MRVRVLYFGALKDVLCRDTETMDLAAPASVGMLLDTIRHARPVAAEYWETLAVAVNQEYASRDRQLQDGDEVALLPPVSGGSEEHRPEAERIAPTLKIGFYRDAIPSAALLAAVKTGEDGAVAAFDGIVRNNTRGRQTMFLVYEAYEEMALAQMRALAAEALVRFSVRDITLVHRLGKLEVGETSIFILVACAHRSAAFDACRWLIDALKKTVPIWKKEHFIDGAVWADGEPFPAEIAISASVAQI